MVEVKRAEYQNLTHDCMHWCNKQIFPRFLIVPPHIRPSWICVYFLEFVVAAVVAVVVVAIVVVVIVVVAAIDAVVIVVAVTVVVDR